MFGLIRILIFVALAALIVGGIIRLIKLIKNLRPSENTIKRDAELLKLAVAARNEELVPWNEEEMELLSLKEVEQRMKKGITEGTLLSIYQEPMVSYAYKKYSGSNDAILYAETSDRSYIYRIKSKGIQVYMNNEPLGTLRPNGVLYNIRKQSIGKITRFKGESSSTVTVKNREVGNIVNEDNSRKFNPKAFSLLAPMKPDEEDVFLSLAILELTMRNVTKQRK